MSASRSETFEWTGALVGPRVEVPLSGLAYLAGVLDGSVAPPRLGPLLSAEIVAVDRGRVQLVCSASESQFGLWHELDPGAAALLLNTAVGCAARSITDARTGWATVTSTASYGRPPAPSIGVVVATAEVVASLPGSALIAAELADAAGNTFARAETTVSILPLDDALDDGPADVPDEAERIAAADVRTA